MSNSTINHPYRVFLVDNFLQYFKENDNPLYIAIGHSDPWPSPTPPRLYDTTKEKTDFKSTLIAMQRVEKTGIIPVIRYHKWKSGDLDFTVFNVNDSNASYKKFYCVNSEGRIYACVGKGAGAVTEQPLGNNMGNDILTADGYTWQYYYTVTASELADAEQNQYWIVMHFAGYASAEQVLYGNRYVNLAFGNNFLMIKEKLTDMIKIGVNYHQIALFSSPTDLQGNLLTTKYPDITKLNPHLHMIYLENRTMITRQIGKSELPQIVLEF